MLNQCKIIKPEDKKSIKIIDNKDEFYLDVNGTKIEGIKKYDIIREAEQPPILKLEIILDEDSYNLKLDCKSNF